MLQVKEDCKQAIVDITWQADTAIKQAAANAESQLDTAAARAHAAATEAATATTAAVTSANEAAAAARLATQATEDATTAAGEATTRATSAAERAETAVVQIEAIRGDALDQGMDSLAMTAEALSAFFRYSISDTSLLASVDSELANIRNYFLIQKYRFGDSLDLEIHFLDDEESIRKLLMPKLTLQPIVENSVFHGIEPQLEKGKISITFDQTAAFLYVSIHDTGIGMPEDVLKKLNASLNLNPFKDDEDRDEEMEAGGQRHTGIALKNVAQRIKLLFGNEYGLSVFSTPGVGTNIVITLPRQESGSPDDGR